MFTDWESRRRSIRESEHKAIERWFSPSPVGLLFQLDDGTAKPIAPVAAEVFKAEAFAMIDEIIDEEMIQVALMFAISIGAAVVLWCLADLFDLNKSGAGVTGFLIGMAFAHFYPMIRLAAVRARHAALRGRIAESLRGTAPVPAPIAARYRRSNPFKLALEITATSLIMMVMLATEDDRFMQVFAFAAVIGVPAAWILFALSKHRDAFQDRVRP